MVIPGSIDGGYFRTTGAEKPYGLAFEVDSFLVNAGQDANLVKLICVIYGRLNFFVLLVRSDILNGKARAFISAYVNAAAIDPGISIQVLFRQAVGIIGTGIDAWRIGRNPSVVIGEHGIRFDASGAKPAITSPPLTSL